MIEQLTWSSWVIAALIFFLLGVAAVIVALSCSVLAGRVDDNIEAAYDDEEFYAMTDEQFERKLKKSLGAFRRDPEAKDKWEAYIRSIREDDEEM